MKNLHTKLKNHGKKVIIHLKRHHRKYLFGALCSGILALVGMMFFSGSKADSILDFLESAQQQGLYGYSNTDFLNITDVTDSYINIESPIIRSGTIDINGYLFVASTTTAQKNPVAYRCFNDVTKDGDNFSVGLSTEGLDDSQVYYIYATPIDSTTGEYNGKCNTNEANEFLQSAASAGSDTTVNGIDPCVVIQDNFYGEGFQCENEKLITYNPDANITYTLNKGFDTEQTFSAGTITISNGEDSITILDRNLGATTNDVNDTGSYGYHFQWGNNYGFDPFDESVTENATTGKATWSQSYINKGYFGNIFIKSTDNTNDYWIDSVENNGNHYNLWGGVYEDNINNTDNYVLTNLSGDNWIVTNPKDRQGPCPDGYHIPNYGELLKIKSMLRGVTSSFHENLLIPFAGGRSYNASLAGVGNFAKLWSSSPFSSTHTDSFTLQIYVDYPIKVGFSGRVGGGSIRCFKNSVDDIPPTCDIAYSTTGQTNQDVLAYLTGCSEEITTEETVYTFTGNGTHTFEFEDLAGNSGEATAIVDRIDKVSPTCDVEYSITGLTNQDVTATLTCDDEDINVTNNGGRVEYTFTGNGTHTFEFQDLAGNTGSAVAEVTGIDKVKPTCDIIYSTTGATTGNVVATLTGCIETITGTETQHTFTGNGTYIFNFQDLAGNTGSTEAAVTWIGEYTGVYEIKSGQQMINLYNQGKAITCNVIYSGDNGHQTNTMYIKSGVINENLMIITGNTRTMLYSLEKDGYIYSWGDMYLDGIGFYIPYELDVYEELKGVDNNIKSGAIITCTTGVEEDSVFDLPDGVDFFNIDTYYIDSGVYFIIDAKETAKTGENIDFTITVMKDGKRFKNFLGYVLIDVIDEDGDLLDKNTYEAPGYGYYYFASSDKGKKTFSNGLKINKTGDYYIRVNSLQEGEGFFPISIKGKNDPTLTGNYFKITVNSKANPGEYTTFTVRAMKDGISYSNYTGTVIFTLSNKDGGLINKRNYTFSNSGRYTFEASDLGRKIFYSGLKINETGTYILEVNGLNDNFKGSTTINVGKSHGSAEFKYDTLKFNPKYSDEMNEAYQYARYYDITTKDSIKDADMYSGLNRIAMAKMLTNYAENVLGKDNFNTGRNCSFSDVSNSLDKDYDYGVTKACQLGIMGVNMPNNKFYPNGGVTRAEFATALSRLLYGTKDGTEKYYSTHITKLRREGIITNTDPALWELRGYVMLMLKRVAEK